MKTFPANLQTHAEGTVTSLTTCLQIELNNFEAVIDDITQADPGQVTVKYPHKLITGNTVIMRDAGGMVEVNDNIYTVTVIDPTTFTINQNTTGYTAYTSGGYANEVLGFTSSDIAVVYSDTTYQPDLGYTPSEVTHSANLAVDGVDLRGILDSTSISEAEILSGRFDYCKLWLFVINPLDISMGVGTIKFGSIGEVSLGDYDFSAEFRGLTHKLEHDTTRTYLPTCDWDFGDADCGKDVDVLEVSGTVTAVSSKRKFEDTSLGQADNYFTRGKLIWLTGNNAGKSCDLRKHLLADPTNPSVTLLDRASYAVQVGDTYAIRPGCAKSRTACKVWGRIVSFGGCPDLAGTAEMLDYGIR